MANIESEKNIEKNLVKETRERGGICLKLPTLFHSGLPDRMCLLPFGRVIFVEVKTTGKKPRKIQLRTHELLRALGFQVEVIDRTAQIEKILAL